MRTRLVVDTGVVLGATFLLPCGTDELEGVVQLERIGQNSKGMMMFPCPVEWGVDGVVIPRKATFGKRQDGGGSRQQNRLWILTFGQPFFAFATETRLYHSQAGWREQIAWGVS